MKRVLTLILISAVSLVSMAAVLRADQLNEEDCKKKKRGWYVTGLPLLSYNTDNGLGYGARLYLYNNGKDTNEDFCTTPFYTQIYGQFYQTLGGWNYHQLFWDQFNIFGTKYRIQASLIYDSKTEANYYGDSDQTTKRNLQDANGFTYHSYSKYRKRFLMNSPTLWETALGLNNVPYGKVNYKYTKYQYVKPTGYLNFFGPVWEDKDWGQIQFLAGFQASNYAIKRWDKRPYNVNDRQWRSYAPTKLQIDRPVGLDGGWVNFLRLGLVYSSLDFEPDPKKGIRLDYSFEMSSFIFGSDYNFYRNTLGGRWYHTWVKGLTTALRLAYTFSLGDTPFYERNQFAFPFYRTSAQGGNRSLRGYQDSRFVGKCMTLGNLELRYHIGDQKIPALGNFGLKIVVFIDAGNVYDKPGRAFTKPDWVNYRWSYGAGLIIPWNQATIIHLYYSKSSEDSALSIDFSHAIQ